MYQSITNGLRAMGPPTTRYHHQLWIKRMLARVKVLPFPRLPLVSVPHELVVGGDVGEALWMIEVRLRECLCLLIRGSMGHVIEVGHPWHLLLVVLRLRERTKY